MILHAEFDGGADPFEGSRDLAMRALLLDPTVSSATAAGRFLDDILEAHRRYLPRFWAD